MNRGRGSWLTRFVILTAVCASGFGAASAATFEVWPDGSGEYPSIRSAVFASIHGDTVLLHNGLYDGPDNHNISFLGKSILLRSESNDPDSCVIDCGGEGQNSDEQGFIFESWEDAGAVLRGVTVIRGRAVWVYGRRFGAGLLIDNGASPRIEDCAFREGQAGFGGGVACMDGSAVFSGCDISGNTADQYGGGLCVDMGATPLFVNCRILDNFSSGGGGAGYIDHYAVPAFRDCTFERNYSDRGGGFFVWWGTASFSNCLFRGNQAGTEGGVIEHLRDSRSEFVDCTFAGNVAPNGSVAFSRDRATFTRCTMYGNENHAGVLCTTEHGKILVDHSIVAFSPNGCAAFCYGVDSISVSCSDFYGNPGGDWRWCVQDDYNGSTNVSVDPLFCAPEEGDFHVDPLSWCAPGNNPGCGQVGAWPSGCAPSGVPAEDLARAASILRITPNPTPGACRIEWLSSRAPGGISVEIYDVKGRRVRAFGGLPAGATVLAWNGRDQAGRPLPSGIYLARARSGEATAAARIILER